MNNKMALNKTYKTSFKIIYEKNTRFNVYDLSCFIILQNNVKFQI